VEVLRKHGVFLKLVISAIASAKEIADDGAACRAGGIGDAVAKSSSPSSD